MRPEQKHDTEPASASREPSTEISPSESSSAARLPENERSTSERRGWRAYFPAAARKDLKPEADDESDSTAVTARFATTLSMLICALFLFVVSASANTYVEYFGYLRRDPDASPDSDFSGYDFWLNKLNQFGGNYVDAEMIKAFITSFEYRQRFAQ